MSGDPKTTRHEEYEKNIHISQRQTRTSNKIRTTKYTKYTFIPYFLYEQFRKLANIYFLFISMLQLIPDLSPTGRFTTLFPLCVVLTFSAFKELYEDFRRRNDDNNENNRKTSIFNRDKAVWSDIKVGDVVIVHKDEIIPCDGIILSSSTQNGEVFVETSQLDGETNLKTKYSCNLTHKHHFKELVDLGCKVEYNKNVAELDAFDGLVSFTEEIPERINEKQLLLRGTKLKRVDEVHILTLFVGEETKQCLNGKGSSLKQSQMEKQTNLYVFVMFCIALLLSLISTIEFFKWNWITDYWYLAHNEENDNASYIRIFFTFVILYNNLVPISLYVFLEAVRTIQGFFIDHDLDISHKFSARCRTTNLVEELGSVRYVFADKTGTLTKNQMQFKKCFIESQEFIEPIDIKKNISTNLKLFFLCLATCHSVDISDGIISASSADEEVLVSLAQRYGFGFKGRSSKTIDTTLGSFQYEVIPFTSKRKRMSVILATKDESIILTKGAESTVGIICNDNKDAILKKVNEYANEGLRTMVIAGRTLSDEETKEIPLLSSQNKLYELEKDLNCLGCTAVEDKLQSGVVESIKKLNDANISVCILTGDMKETALAIAKNSGVIKHNTNYFIMGGTEAYNMIIHDTTKFIDTFIHSDGSGCIYRCTPAHKAAVVKTINGYLCHSKSVFSTLSIGDGANDVAMLRTAHVGIGIRGKEGMTATGAADFSVERFRDIVKLLFVHGRYSYQRIAIFTSHTLYRSILLFITQFYFAFASGFSGTSIYERWCLVMFNVLFSALLPLVVACFDKDYEPDQLISKPQHYLHVTKYYSIQSVLMWFFDGILESLIIFVCGLYMIDGDMGNGSGDIGMDGFGFMIYGAIVIVSSFHLASHTHTFTISFYVALLISVILFYIWYFAYGLVGGLNIISMGESVYMLAFNMFSLLKFWLVFLWIVCVALIKPTIERWIYEVQRNKEIDVKLSEQDTELFMHSHKNQHIKEE
ncbi:Phospholipid-transporting P-type ATPase [Entamoeba marina]